MQHRIINVNIFKTALYLGAVLLFFTACEEKVAGELGELNLNFADRTIIDAHLVYKDSGIVRLDLKSPLIEEFTLIDSPYTLMKKGLNVQFWNGINPKPNRLKADWAKILDLSKFYEGKGNVEMINVDGDTLRTNHIFWDNARRRIFTTDTVKILRRDGSINISNHGMDASEDFREFEFYQNHGIIVFNEDGSPVRVPDNQAPPPPPPPDMQQLDYRPTDPFPESPRN
ncbi:MAG: LPS export ABC transporter periplasmic protein LptC [Weeksellaceae bacterium]|nr:LPS export ABC transporter periplasmic protein LptC [Weeksellaceae bacterium]